MRVNSSPFPVAIDASQSPSSGVWHPVYGLVAHSDRDSFICTACGDMIGTYSAGVRLDQLHWIVNRGHLVGAVIPVDDQGRCPDCQWMENPVVEPLRHVVSLQSDVALGKVA